MAENQGACPCNYGDPCDERCTCVDPLSSSGCRMCCTYGSLEQRKCHAKWSMALLRAYDDADGALMIVGGAVGLDDPQPSNVPEAVENLVQEHRRLYEVTEALVTRPSPDTLEAVQKVLDSIKARLRMRS